MKITKVEALPLWASFSEAFDGAENVPRELTHPAFGMRVNPLGGQGGAIVRVHTDSGLIGTGESMGRPGARGIAALINEVLAPMLVDQDPLATEVHFAHMLEELRWMPMAISGVDTALWDLRAQAHNQPIYRQLGGPLRTKIDCYASPIPYRETPDDSAAKAREFIEQGFLGIKLKIGRGINTDLDHVAAVRAEVGTGIKLLVDANGAYTVAQAIQLAKGLVDAGVYWFEEPVHPEYPADLAAIRRRVDLPIVSGEWLGSIYQFRDLLNAEAADIIMPNITRVGGITGMRRVAEMAAMHNVPISPHGVGTGISVISALQSIAAMPNFLIYEYNQLFNPLRHSLLNEPLDFQNGQLIVSDRVGLGHGIKMETVEQYSV